MQCAAGGLPVEFAPVKQGWRIVAVRMTIIDPPARPLSLAPKAFGVWTPPRRRNAKADAVGAARSMDEADLAAAADEF
jgi:hypothetical protein